MNFFFLVAQIPKHKIQKLNKKNPLKLSIGVWPPGWPDPHELLIETRTLFGLIRRKPPVSGQPGGQIPKHKIQTE
jgi:hypothetical protein